MLYKKCPYFGNISHYIKITWNILNRVPLKDVIDEIRNIIILRHALCLETRLKIIQVHIFVNFITTTGMR